MAANASSMGNALAEPVAASSIEQGVGRVAGAIPTAAAEAMVTSDAGAGYGDAIIGSSFKPNDLSTRMLDALKRDMGVPPAAERPAITLSDFGEPDGSPMYLTEDEVDRENRLLADRAPAIVTRSISGIITQGGVPFYRMGADSQGSGIYQPRQDSVALAIDPIQASVATALPLSSGVSGNAGLGPGLSALQDLTPAQVFEVRNMGTPIPGKSYTQTDYIAQYAGFDRKVFGSLKPADIAANLDIVQPYVRASSDKYGVSSDLVNAIIVNESKGMENAVSPTGALGVAQLTYGIYGSSQAIKTFGSAINPFSPESAIDRQTALLSQLSEHYDGDQNMIVAAYNQGQTAVDNSIKRYGVNWAQHIQLEGQNYIKSISVILSGSRNIPGYFKR